LSLSSSFLNPLLGDDQYSIAAAHHENEDTDNMRPSLADKSELKSEDTLTLFTSTVQDNEEKEELDRKAPNELPRCL
jgi:hypothetical protein